MSSKANPQTKEELRERLGDLLKAAYMNGVELDDGAYGVFHTDPAIPDWDIEIIRMEKRSE